jgi:CIC family chloride channel protein
VLGATVGLVVSGFEWLAEAALHEVLHLEVWQLAIAPGIGLCLSALILRTLGFGASPSTSDEYVRAYHERNPEIRLREMPGRLLAGVATVGLGGSLGLEGPAIYTGATLGVNVRRFFERWFTRDEAKMLLTAGAAAGVAAIFRTPATGVIFALEVPYYEDVSRKALIPALLSSAASYTVFTVLIDGNPVVPQATGGEDIQTAIIGAVIVGILAGLGARVFANVAKRAKRATQEFSLVRRLAAASVTLGALAVLSTELFHKEALSLGPGVEAMRFAISEEPGITLLFVLLGIRIVATLASIAGGGTGGLFIPLAVNGWLLGAIMGEVMGEDSTSQLFPTLGLAAFLGAGYRAPLASVMFVAESTSVGGFVVPALIAAAAATVVSGGASVAGYQRGVRQGHLERRLGLPLTSALTTDVLTVPSDATVAEFAIMHVLGRRQRVVPVVDDGVYKGMCGLDELGDIERADWDAHLVADIMRRDAPAAEPSWTLRDAVATMEKASLDVLAVTDGSGVFIGVVDSDEVLRLDEILDETGDVGRIGW